MLHCILALTAINMTMTATHIEGDWHKLKGYFKHKEKRELSLLQITSLISLNSKFETANFHQTQIYGHRSEASVFAFNGIKLEVSARNALLRGWDKKSQVKSTLMEASIQDHKLSTYVSLVRISDQGLRQEVQKSTSDIQQELTYSVHLKV